jgi:hypothetical protein
VGGLATHSGFSIKDSHDMSYYTQKHYDISFSIESIMDRYHMTKYPDTVVILYKELILDSNLFFTIKNIDKIPLNKNVINLSRSRSFFNSKYLPISLDDSNFGNLLESYIRTKSIDDLLCKQVNEIDYNKINENGYARSAPRNLNSRVFKHSDEKGWLGT